MQRIKSSGEPVDVSEREYFQEPMKGSTFLTDIQIGKSSGTRIITMAVPVKDESGSAIGIIQRNYNLSVFHEMLASEIIEDQQEIVMVDTQGSVIAHSSHEIDPSGPEDQSMNPFYTDSRGTTTTGCYDTVWEGKKWMVYRYKEAATGRVIASCRVTSVAMKASNTAALMNILIGVAFLVIFGILALFLSKSFTDPTREISESMEALADGRFLMISRFTERDDEFGSIIRETNSVIQKLKTIVAEIKGSADSVNHSSEALSTMVDGISQTSDSVSSAVQEIADGATQQAGEIQDTVENTIVISHNIQNVTEKAETVTRIAEEMSANSKDSGAQLQKLKASSDDMNNAIEEFFRNDFFENVFQDCYFRK